MAAFDLPAVIGRSPGLRIRARVPPLVAVAAGVGRHHEVGSAGREVAARAGAREDSVSVGSGGRGCPGERKYRQRGRGRGSGGVVDVVVRARPIHLVERDSQVVRRGTPDLLHRDGDGAEGVAGLVRACGKRDTLFNG